MMFGWFKKKERASIDPEDIIKIHRLYPIVANAAEKLILNATKEHLNIGVFSSLRTIEEQRELYAKGRSKPGDIITNSRISYHNFGLAVDIVFKDDKGNWSWDKHHNWNRLGEIGKEVGFEWGGDWETIKDFPHFQMTFGLSLKDLERLLGDNNDIGQIWAYIDDLNRI